MVKFGASLTAEMARSSLPEMTTRSCSGTQRLASTPRLSRSPIVGKSPDAEEPPLSPSSQTHNALVASPLTQIGSLLLAMTVLSRSEQPQPLTLSAICLRIPPSGSRSWPSRQITSIWPLALTTTRSTSTGRLTGVSRASAPDTAHTLWLLTGAPILSSSERTAAPTSYFSSRFPPASRTHLADQT